MLGTCATYMILLRLLKLKIRYVIVLYHWRTTISVSYFDDYILLQGFYQQLEWVRQSFCWVLIGKRVFCQPKNRNVICFLLIKMETCIMGIVAKVSVPKKSLAKSYISRGMTYIFIIHQNQNHTNWSQNSDLTLTL